MITWQNSASNRLLLDAGGYHFRLSRAGEPAADYLSMSRLMTDKRQTPPKPLPADHSLVNEADFILPKCHTKGILTNYVNFNELFNVAYQQFDVSNDRKALKNFALFYHARPFQPVRARCNDLEFFFELHGFNAVRPVVAGEEVFGVGQRRSGLLIDIGHSHTYIIPVFNNTPVKNGIRRLEVGGSLLTKCLMDGLSFSQIDLKKHYFLTNHIRESCLRVLPKDEARSIARRKSPWDAGIYQLPVYHEDTPGRYVATPTEQERYRKHLRVSAESALLPELLFDPSM